MTQERGDLMGAGVGRRVESLFWAGQAAMFAYELCQSLIRHPSYQTTLPLAVAFMCSVVLFGRAWKRAERACSWVDDIYVAALTSVQVISVALLSATELRTINADTPLVVVAIPIAVYAVIRIVQGRELQIRWIAVVIAITLLIASIVGYALFVTFRAGMEAEAIQSHIEPAWVDEIVWARILWIHIAVGLLLVTLVVLVSRFSQAHRNVKSAMIQRVQIQQAARDGSSLAKDEDRGEVELGAEIRWLRLARGRFGTRVLYLEQAVLSEALLLGPKDGQKLRRYFRDILEKEPRYLTVSVSHKHGDPRDTRVTLSISGLSNAYELPASEALSVNGEITWTVSATRIGGDPVRKLTAEQPSRWVQVRERIWPVALGERVIQQRPGFGVLSDAVTGVLLIVLLDASMSVIRLLDHVHGASRLLMVGIAGVLSVLTIWFSVRGFRGHEAVAPRRPTEGVRDEFWLMQGTPLLLVSATAVISLAFLEDGALADRGVLGSPRPLAVQFTIVIALVAAAANNRRRVILTIVGIAVLFTSAAAAGVIDLDAGLDGIRPAIASVYWLIVAVVLAALAREVVLQIEQVFELSADMEARSQVQDARSKAMTPADWLISVSEFLQGAGVEIHSVAVYERGRTWVWTDWWESDGPDIVACEVRGAVSTDVVGIDQKLHHCADHAQASRGAAYYATTTNPHGGAGSLTFVLRADFSRSLAKSSSGLKA